MRIGPIALLGALAAVGATGPAPGGAPAACSSAAPATRPGRPPLPFGTPYYDVDLVTTKILPGTARAGGTGRVTYARSPFGVAVSADGSYRYDVALQLTGIEAPARGVLVAWLTTPQVDHVRRLGAFDADLGVHGDVSWNKFLLVVTLEASDDPSAGTWSGPIVLRGMSRSGMMHTMAGHGPFQQELCAKYGYR